MLKLSNTQTRVALGLLGVVLLVIGFGLGRRGHGSAPPADANAVHDHQVAKPTLWTCSMHPQIQLLEPGLCPICGMQLIPLEDDRGAEMAGMRELTVSEVGARLMALEVAPVERRLATATVRMVGKVDYDETRLATITAWIPGRLDRLYVDYTGVPVREGDHLVELYSPQLLIAQEALLQALATVRGTEDSGLTYLRDSTRATVEETRDKLRLWGLKPEQIAQIESTGRVSDHMTIYAPMGGIVIHRQAVEGMYVQEGAPLYTIADLSQVWVKLDAYESDLQWLRYGQDVAFTTVSYPGEVFRGTVAFIDPVLDPKTRTAKVRVNVSNSDGRLKPEMFVKASVRAHVAAGGRVVDASLAGRWICSMHPEIVKEAPGTCDICGMDLVQTESLGYATVTEPSAKPLVIPVSAALVTGTRAIVYVQKPATDRPTFEGREIVLGPRAGDVYLVRSGLQEGELVVTQGNFKIDSALQILAKPSMMTPDGGGGGGHHHGGGQPMGGDRAAMTMGPELTALSRHQIEQVVAAGHAVHTALATGDLVSLRTAATAFGERLDAVDMASLDGEAHKLWMELAMRLRNDAVEMAQAETVTAAQAVGRSLAANLGQVQSRLGVGAAQATAASTMPPAALRGQLGALVRAYVTLQQALAADNGQGAVTAATEAQQAVASVDMSLFSQADHGLWMEAQPLLAEALKTIAAAHELQTQREAFARVSKQIIGLSQRFGALGADSVFVMHCPMALDNRGADWLQDSEELKNPYFGAMMLGCGEVTAVIPQR